MPGIYFSGPAEYVTFSGCTWIARSNRDAHLVGDFARMLAETERRVDVHHVHASERGSEQRVARFGELHLLLGRHPTDQRHMVHSCRVFGRTNAHKPDRMALPLQFLRPLQRRIRRAVTLGFPTCRPPWRWSGVAVFLPVPSQTCTPSYADGTMEGMTEENRALGTPLGKHPTRVLFLGSGELGKEVTLELMRLGAWVCAADSYDGAPAAAGGA